MGGPAEPQATASRERERPEFLSYSGRSRSRLAKSVATSCRRGLVSNKNHRTTATGLVAAMGDTVATGAVG